VHKLAAFESMTFRMFNTPLSQEKFKKEKQFIMETAKINGYNNNTIQNLFEKHLRKRELKDLTTLKPETKNRIETVKSFNGQERISFAKLPFVP
jgi:hypothetical protein